ncbi:MAG: stage II sporulation protein M, partial [Flavisolibacter sp.]
MREGLFIKKNKDRWENIRNGGSDDADEMARDFVGLVDDLAYAKTFYPASKVTKYINSLASRIYLRIYQNRREESNRLVTFWKFDVPYTIGKHYRVMLFTVFLFLLFYVLGFFS